MFWLRKKVNTITYQPALRPALPCVYGPIDYREQRALFQHIDAILSASGLEGECINLNLAERQVDPQKSTAARFERFAKYSVLALRSNIARTLTGLDHRDFAIRLADSTLLQWFLQVGEMGDIKTFSKSTSARLSRWAGEQTVRTLMKATVLIRKHGLKHRMPQEPLAFLSDMNTLCMKMTAKSRTGDGAKHRKKVLREMKALEKRIAAHARAHVTILKARRHETDLTEPQAQLIIERIENVLEQLPAAIKQAHERIIGGRQVSSGNKILSLYDDQINVIVRGKAGARVEFGNKLWLGETREGIIIDYQFHQDNPSDSALVKPAIERLIDQQQIIPGNVWGDRGTASVSNTIMLEKRGIGNGLCPRNVSELTDKLATREGFREGLKRRAATEERIGIF
jgi:hypothetical protein